MRIAVLGANGQLGRDLLKTLDGEIVGLQRPEVDVCAPATLHAAFERIRPDVVINTAAFTHVDQCERDQPAAFAVNAIGAGSVARATAACRARLIYISTDYVFGNQQPTSAIARDEIALTAPLNAYGASKLAGEALTAAHAADSLIVRTSGLYGHAGARGKGGNFVETMLRLAGEGKPLRVVDDQRLSPTSTAALARALDALIRFPATGTLHLAACDHCTWYEFAREIFRLAEFDAELTPIPSSEYPQPARRPCCSALCSRRLRELGLDGLPSWREMLRTYIQTRPANAATATTA